MTSTSDASLSYWTRQFKAITLAASDDVQGFASQLLLINQEITKMDPLFAYKDWQLSLHFINNLDDTYQKFVDSLLASYSISGVRGTKTLTFHEFVEKVKDYERRTKGHGQRDRATGLRESFGGDRVQNLRRSFQ